MKRRALNSEQYDNGSIKVKLEEQSVEPMGVQLINQFRTTRHDQSDLVELAMEIDKVDNVVRATTCGKLQVIAEQLRCLQKQAHTIIDSAKLDTQLHHAACNFQKRPGRIYFLFRREFGQLYFSMLSPQDWGDSLPHQFVGAYRLEPDLSWTPVEEIVAQEAEMAVINKCLGCHSTSTMMMDT